MELQQREKNNPKADKSRAMKTGHLYVLRTEARSWNSETGKGEEYYRPRARYGA